jgi:hypothetical protein
MPVLGPAIALKPPYNPAANGGSTILLEDHFTEAADTDLTSHTPDTLNLAAGWVAPASRNPCEVVGGAGYARSKNVSGLVQGWAFVDLGTANVEIIHDMQAFSTATGNMYTYLAADDDAANCWAAVYSLASAAVYLYERIANTNTTRDSASITASTGERRLIFTRSGDAMTVDFNSGEASLGYSSATTYGTRAGFNLPRTSAGSWNALYWKATA